MTGLRPKSDRSLIKFGGLVGLLGGVASVIVNFAGQALGPNPLVDQPTDEALATHQADMVKFLTQLSQNPQPFVETFMISIAMAAMIPLTVALYSDLRETDSPYALIGLVFGALWAGTTLMFDYGRYTSETASAYLYSTATAASQPVVVAAAESTFYSTYSTFIVAGCFGAFSLLALGCAMLRSPSFGRKFGSIALVFGVILGLSQVWVAPSLWANPTVENPGFLFTALVIWLFPIIFGLKLLLISRKPPALAST